MPRYTRRTTALRFKAGEAVQISNIITSFYAGQIGIIAGIRSSRYSHTLDKYLVRFPSGDEVIFWDIQLKSAEVSPKENTVVGSVPEPDSKFEVH